MTVSVAIVTQSLLVLPQPVMDGTQSPQIIFSWNSEESLFVGPDIVPKSVSTYSLKVLINLINKETLLLPILNPMLVFLNLQPDLLYH